MIHYQFNVQTIRIMVGHIPFDVIVVRQYQIYVVDYLIFKLALIEVILVGHVKNQIFVAAVGWYDVHNINQHKP
jgi:hypothetical protein